MNVIDKLAKKTVELSSVCVGLDVTEELLPDFIKRKDLAPDEKFIEFNKKIIDATMENANCYKLQIACYEALGLSGMRAFFETLKYLKSKNQLFITDCKRGDISSTASLYAKAHFSGDFEADAITVNAYMGEDAVSPYYPYLEKGKAIFVLVKTSNRSSVDIEDIEAKDGEPVYAKMSTLVSKWGAPFLGESGFSAIGAVLGLTYASDFAKIKNQMKNTFLLIPGYGAQGGTAEDIGKLFALGARGVVNSSRGIIGAHRGKTTGADYDLYIADASKDMKESIAKWL
ncbi:MAG: orotidine-5'-phosphate decarboxylase [Clostridia bacterium]